MEYLNLSYAKELEAMLTPKIITGFFDHIKPILDYTRENATMKYREVAQNKMLCDDGRFKIGYFCDETEVNNGYYYTVGGIEYFFIKYDDVEMFMGMINDKYFIMTQDYQETMEAPPLSFKTDFVGKMLEIGIDEFVDFLEMYALRMTMPDIAITMKGYSEDSDEGYDSDYCEEIVDRVLDEMISQKSFVVFLDNVRYEFICHTYMDFMVPFDYEKYTFSGVEKLTVRYHHKVYELLKSMRRTVN
jgi:hypothetical protein